jgi:hypothetical protein
MRPAQPDVDGAFARYFSNVYVIPLVALRKFRPPVRLILALICQSPLFRKLFGTLTRRQRRRCPVDLKPMLWAILTRLTESLFKVLRPLWVAT